MKIKATQERQTVLDENGIRYKVDDELNFVFSTNEEKAKAEKVLRNALLM